MARGGLEPWRELVAVLAARGDADHDAVHPERIRAPVRQLVLGVRDGVRADRGSVGLVPVTIGFYLSGNVLDDPHLGQALAFGMLVVLALMMLAYVPLQRRASRWSR